MHTSKRGKFVKKIHVKFLLLPCCVEEPPRTKQGRMKQSQVPWSSAHQVGMHQDGMDGSNPNFNFQEFS